MKLTLRYSLPCILIATALILLMTVARTDLEENACLLLAGWFLGVSSTMRK